MVKKTWNKLRTGKGSSKIAAEENIPPTLKLTLSQTLTLAGGRLQFSSVAIAGFPQP